MAYFKIKGLRIVGNFVVSNPRLSNVVLRERYVIIRRLFGLSNF